MLKKFIIFFLFLSINASIFGVLTDSDIAFLDGKYQPISSGLAAAGGLMKSVGVGGLKYGLEGIKVACGASPITVLSMLISAGGFLYARKVHQEIKQTKEEARQAKEAAQRSEIHAKSAAENSSRAVEEARKNREILKQHTLLHEQHLQEQKKTQQMIEATQVKLTAIEKEQQEQKNLMQSMIAQQKEMAKDSKEEFEKVHDGQHKTFTLIDHLGQNVGAMQTQIAEFRQYVGQSTQARADFELRQEDRQKKLDQTLSSYSQRQDQMIQLQNDHFTATDKKIEGLREDMDMHQRENKAKLKEIRSYMEEGRTHLAGIQLVMSTWINRANASYLGFSNANVNSNISFMGMHYPTYRKGKRFTVESDQKRGSFISGDDSKLGSSSSNID